jgi:hypothetical protein
MTRKAGTIQVPDEAAGVHREGVEAVEALVKTNDLIHVVS